MPYGEHTVLGYSTAASKAQNQDAHRFTKVSIDGPALAHHIYHKLLACRPVRGVPSDAAIAAQPSYDEIGRGFLCYLEKLEEFRVIM